MKVRGRWLGAGAFPEMCYVAVLRRCAAAKGPGVKRRAAMIDSTDPGILINRVCIPHQGTLKAHCERYKRRLLQIYATTTETEQPTLMFSPVSWNVSPSHVNTPTKS
uniref:SFRICE_029796 n=1 Tax=Spodoptera frugiperda TaxID=7108 RepID=A0A2H1WFP7_SPOFR